MGMEVAMEGMEWGYLINHWSRCSLQARKVSSFSLSRSHHYRWATPSSGARFAPRPPCPPTRQSPHPGRGTAVGCARQALRELRSGGGGCSRRPGGRRREAVPQFVSNQGVRAVPRAGQQCVNKPSGNSSAPLARSPRAHRRRLRRRHRHRHRGLGCRRPLPHIPPLSAPLPPRGHPDPPPAQLAPRHPALLRPRPRGLLTYRPTRARSCTTRPVRPARNVASRELGKSDARGPRGWLPGFGNFLARLFFRWALG